jgi:MFS family permease
LATFAAGFVVRPFGALFFGRLGDLIGKYTFMVTLLLMGGTTFLIGCIPSYETWIHGAFISINSSFITRSCTGVNMAEPQPMWPSMLLWDNEDIGLLDSDYCNGGLFISLMVILATRNILTPEQFDEWGWRVPFWLSIVMVGVSYLIRKTWMNHLFS